MPQTRFLLCLARARLAGSAALLLAVALAALLTSPLAAGVSVASICENGTVIPDPAQQPQLVADCEALLAAKDALRGTAELNWNAETPLSDWDGVSVAAVPFGGPRRVTELRLDRRGLNGSIPPALGRLDALHRLRLGFNRLSGPIPAQLGQLHALTLLMLNGNRLSGPIPPELGRIGPQLTSLQVAGPHPLPDGVGLTGPIPPQLGNLAGLRFLAVDHNRLTGAVPVRLGRLANLSWLSLEGNQLTGPIPTQLGDLTQLTNLRLDDNQLSGPIPSQLGRLGRLTKVYLLRNAGFSGCAPPSLRRVRFNDVARLGLPDCPPGAPATPTTPLPTYSLTATAGPGGAVDPAGVSTHPEAAAVVLTASWNDATHTFAGWSGACAGTETTCTVELYADTVVSAAFTPLPAERCAAPTDADCIRAVFLGRPDEFAQVQDIPPERLLQPQPDGRYRVERGQLVTVVTAAPRPAGFDRFLLKLRPNTEQEPVSSLRLIPPVGTKFTFSVSEHAADLERFQLDLHAARTRPGATPAPGPLVVSTAFQVPPAPLRLELTSSRELCTAGTLTELSWTITGGAPPYTLTIDGQTVDAGAESHRVNCGPLDVDPMTDEPLHNPTKVFTATVSDSQSPAGSAEGRTRVNLAEALAPPSVGYGSLKGHVTLSTKWPVAPDYSSVLIRSRERDGDAWAYTAGTPRRNHDLLMGANPRSVAAAAMRHDIEALTPSALRWSDPLRVASALPPRNVRVSATHDTITVSWDKQPLMRGQRWLVGVVPDDKSGSWRKSFAQATGETGRHTVQFPGVAPDTDYTIRVAIATADNQPETRKPVRTAAAPAGWSPPPRGPQNLRATSTHDSITVWWESPYPGAQESWNAQLRHVTSHAMLNYRGVGSEKTWTFRKSRNGVALKPNTRYRINVAHMTWRVAEAEIVVATGPAPSRSGRSAVTEDPENTGRLPFAVRWPVSMDGRYAMTDDPFEWRQDHFHAGLDIGERGGGVYGSAAGSAADVQGEPVYAAAAGWLRLFGHREAQVVVYCHDEELPMHERFHVTEMGMGSAWWTGERLRRYQEGDRPGDTFCDHVATTAGGRAALIAHGLPQGVQAVTKYAHLDSVAPEIIRGLAKDRACLDAPDWVTRCDIDHERAVHVRQGQQIGGVGQSYYGDDNRFADDHLHFEIRTFNGPAKTEDEWYEWAFGCASGRTSDRDCEWIAGSRRWLETVEDAEEYLAPLPASTTPTDPGWGTGRPIADANRGRTVFEVASARADADSVTVGVSAAFWRPLFYTGFDGQRSRAQPRGIQGTGPGVAGYGTDIVAAPGFADSACGGGRLVAAPPTTDSTTEGELRRQVREVRVSATGRVCRLYILTMNATFPVPEAPSVPMPNDLYRANIAIADPHATVTFGGALPVGTGRESGRLSGTHFQVYRFEAYRGVTYRFCSTKLAGECVNELSGSGVVLELWQGAERLRLSPVANISWQAPAYGTYFLVVRGDYAEGASSPNSGPYTLHYELPRVEHCDESRPLVLHCVPHAPAISGIGNLSPNGFTVEFRPRYRATGYRVELSVDDAATVEDLDNFDPKAESLSREFVGLEPNTRYAVRVQAFNATGPSDWSASRQAPTPQLPYCANPRDQTGPRSARSTQCRLLAAPTMPSVSQVTDRTATLHWQGEAGRVFELHRVTGAAVTREDCEADLPQDLSRLARTSAHSYPFTRLRPATPHLLCVRATRTLGEGAGAVTVRSAWTWATVTTLASALMLSIDAAAAADDGTINAGEWNAGFSIGGRATPGAEVTLTVGGTALAAVTADMEGAWSVAVPARASYVIEGELTVTAAASLADHADASDSARFRVDLTAPAVSYPSPAALTVGILVSLNPTVTGNNDIASYRVTMGQRLPTYLVLDPPTGVISGTPAAEASASTTEIEVRDHAGNSSRATVSLPAVVGAACADQDDRVVHRRSPITRTRYFLLTGGQSAQGQQDTGERVERQTLVWRGEPVCAYADPDEDDWMFERNDWDDDWLDRGTPVARPADEEQVRDAGLGDQTRWVLQPSGTSACEQIEQLSERRTRGYAFSASGPWVAGEWGEWGDPYRSGWERTEMPCLNKLDDEDEVEEVGLGTATRKALNAAGTAACPQTEVLSHRRTNTYVFSAASGWALNPGEWGESYRSGWRTTGTCISRPSPQVEAVVIEARTETRWDRRDVIVCLEYEQSRTGRRYAHYRRPYIWNAAAMEWQVGPREPTAPIFTSPPGVFSHTAWSDTGVTRLCPLRTRDGAGSPSAQLPAGDYVVRWGSVQFAFTVPAGEDVTLFSRSLDSGAERAVFSVAGGAELIVEPAALSRDAESNAALFTGVSDATLSALARTLRLADAPVSGPVTAPSACVAIERPTAGAAAVDVSANPCAFLPGGGALTAHTDDRSLSLSLPVGRDWLLVRHTTTAGVLALTLVDVASGGVLNLSFADAGELSRQIPDGNTDLAPLFSNILNQATASNAATTGG